MLLQSQPPADTSAFMIAGYAVIFGVMLLYVISLSVRRRSLSKDLEMMQDLDQLEE